jgi:iron complex outermembrane receptor protein
MFSLGGINLMGGTVISNEQTWYFGKQTLADAMQLAPGVVDSNSGGPRNERLIFVRGFNRWQVPLSIDGVRIYLPYDNRLDFGQFANNDIAEIQIAKGYASVLDGPGAIGGAINLVTKRPTKELEVEASSSMSFGRDGSYEGFSSYGAVGTRQKYWYMMVTGTITDKQGWMLPEDFKPTASQGSGWRDNSQSDNWRVTAKVGVTPNATDEYSVGFTHQDGEKGAPFSVTDPLSSQKDWTWPIWNVTDIYTHSTTRIGQASYINTKLYYSMFDNTLASYDNAALNTQTSNKAFTSFYHDIGYGGSVDGGTDLTNWDTLKGAFHYRRDIHVEYQDLYTASACGNGTSNTLGSAPCQEPHQTSMEDVYSVAVENTYHATNKIDFVAAASYDWRILYEAQDWTTSQGLFDYTKIGLKGGNYGDAFNWQSALVYRYSNDAKVYASVSDRTRFPTLFERFSSKFGGALSNPDLVPEEARNFEIGWAGKLWKANLSTAVFYSDVNNLIESVAQTGQYAGYTMSKNVGNGYMEGWEAAADIPVTSNLMAGGNVTVMRMDITQPGQTVIITGVPDVKGIGYVSWQPMKALTITPSVEFASSRWTSNTAGTVYYQTGAFTIANFSAEYQLRPGVNLLLTGRNLFDANYSLTDGQPEPGRTVTFGVKMKF